MQANSNQLVTVEVNNFSLAEDNFLIFISGWIGGKNVNKTVEQTFHRKETNKKELHNAPEGIMIPNAEHQMLTLGGGVKSSP